MCWKHGFIGGLVLGALIISATAQPQLVVQSNHLVITGGVLNVPDGVITVKSGATLTMHQPATVVTGTLQIDTTGLVQGCGTLMAAVLNHGMLVANCGADSSLTITGSITNHGTIRASHGSALIANEAPFLNDGTLDLLTGVNALPAMLTNNGLIQTIGLLSSANMTFDGTDVSLRLNAPAGHTYQLQARADLTTGDWLNIGTPQSGNNGTLLFTHPDGATFARYFYRYVVGDD